MHDFNGSFYGVFWTFAEKNINFIMCFEGVVSRCAVIYDADFLKCTTVWRKTYVFKPPQSQAEPDGRPGSQVEPCRARQPGSQAETGSQARNSRIHGRIHQGIHSDFFTVIFCQDDFLSR